MNIINLIGHKKEVPTPMMVAKRKGGLNYSDISANCMDIKSTCSTVEKYRQSNGIRKDGMRYTHWHVDIEQPSLIRCGSNYRNINLDTCPRDDL